MYRPLYDPVGLPILRPGDFQPSGLLSTPRANQIAFRPTDFIKEEGADFAAPIVGSAPSGLGFNFGDSFRRTGRGVMEFNLPTGQVSVINESLRFAAENVFVGKALRLKTDFTCQGLRNATPDDSVNKFLDQVFAKLHLRQVYRHAVWQYYAVGLVPILFNEPDKPISYCQILDPRQVRVQRWYGKQYMYMLPDRRMLDAIADPKGKSNPFNKDYWDAMPKDWRDQILEQIRKSGGTTHSGIMIRLSPGSYTVIENRSTAIDRTADVWDGAPLQPYFSACQQYRQLMAGDFAASFLAKNLIALVSIGDPKLEGENYERPDSNVLAMLQAAVQNPNYAQWIYSDPTFNVRYITPDPDTFGSAKYDEVRGALQELLPNCFWSGEEGSFANSAVSLKALQEEVDACNQAFDEDFFRVIYERATERNPRVAKKDISTPLHDHSSLEDSFSWLSAQSQLYNNGGLSIRSLIEAHGYDYDTEVERLKQEKKEVKKGTFVPAFEAKQGIVTGVLEKDGVIESTANEPTVPKSPLAQIPPGTTIKTAAAPAGGAQSGSKSKRTRSKRGSAKANAKPNGRPSKPNSRPQPETNQTRAPRPSNGGSK